MAEALVSLVLQQLALVLHQQTEAKVRLVVGVDEEVQKLTSNFQTLLDVLDNAENRQVKEKAVRGWLGKLKHTSYDIDDVLDEWNTAIRKLQMKELENGSDVSRKVRSLIRSFSFSPRSVVLRHDIAIRIKDLNKKLDNIVREKDIFDFSLVKGTKELVRQMTTSFSDEPVIYGRDHIKNTIINCLVSESSQISTLPIISIVGMGGIGKTTLARLVFNDDLLSSHFDIKIWVCVSDPFEEIRIAKAILESLKGDASDLVELENVLQHIHQSIKGKKLLLVLDDVWTEDPKNWEQLKGSLKCSSQSSRILVTTRKENVAYNMGTTNMIQLETLSEEDCWSLFSQVAFARRTIEDRGKLEKIGRDILQKCNGLPLAVKTLGSLLSSKTKVEQWQNVLNSEMWKIKEIEKGLFPPLLLSFYDLSSILRKCFSYCAIFPKDYKLYKDELIKLWIAQDYLIVDESEDVELIGEDYFEKLAMRSFFQDFERSEYDGNITRCKMHDIVHDFAQFLTKNECSTIEVNGLAKSQLEFSCQEYRHLMIIGNSIPISIYNAKKLRSLVVESTTNFKMGVDLSKLLDKLTCLRTLNLSKCSIEVLPKGLNNLIHLRYLKLSENRRLKKLPETLCDLYNLQTLDLTFCSGLRKLPQGIAKLIKLRHLTNIGTDKISYMPKGMEKLICLRTLSKFIVSGDRYDSKACTLECLKHLNHLRGSFILSGLGNLADVSDATIAKLNSKKNLLSLSLKFDREKVKRRMNEENEIVLDALQPTPDLEKLEIKFYLGKTVSPHWMETLTKLRELTLNKCISCEYLPPLGKLPSLESLYLWRMDSVKSVSNEFLGINYDTIGTATSIIFFSKLKNLVFKYMKEWEEWDIMRVNENITIMPCLHSLIIRSSNKLKALPDHILQMSTLRELEIYDCPLLANRYERRTGEDWHKISHIPYILI